MTNETYVSNPTQTLGYLVPPLFVWGQWRGNSIAARDQLTFSFNSPGDAASFQVEVYYKKDGVYVTELHTLPVGGGDLTIHNVETGDFSYRVKSLTPLGAYTQITSSDVFSIPHYSPDGTGAGNNYFLRDASIDDVYNIYDDINMLEEDGVLLLETDNILVSESGADKLIRVYNNSQNETYLVLEQGELQIVTQTGHDSPSSLKFNNDETITLIYQQDISGTINVIERRVDSFSDFNASELYNAQKIIADGATGFKTALTELLETNPDAFIDITSLNLPAELEMVLTAIYEDALAVEASADYLYEMTDQTSVQSADGETLYQKKTSVLDFISSGTPEVSNADLVYLSLNGSEQFADQRIEAFWTLRDRALNDGVITTDVSGNTSYELADGLKLEVINTGDSSKKIELIKYPSVVGKPIGVITTYVDQFQNQVVEVLGGEENSAVVNITTSSTTLNQAFTGGTITLQYPDDFVFSTVGGYVGNAVGQQLADGDVYKGVLYGAALKTVGQHTGTFLDFLAEGTETADSLFGSIFGSDTNTAQTGLIARDDIFEGLVKNLQAGIVSSVGSYITNELTDLVDIDGIGGEVFSVVGNTITTGVIGGGVDILFNGLDGGAYAQLLENGFNFSDPILNADGTVLTNAAGETVTVGDQIQASIWTVAVT